MLWYTVKSAVSDSIQLLTIISARSMLQLDITWRSSWLILDPTPPLLAVVGMVLELLVVLLEGLLVRLIELVLVELLLV